MGEGVEDRAMFRSLSEENSLMWPMIVSAMLRPLSRAVVEERNWQGFHVGAERAS